MDDGPADDETVNDGKQDDGTASDHPTDGKRLFLIDGPSLVYRAFFALPESIATSTGEPTNAIFGFASMLVKLITEHGSAPTIVVWDAGHSGRAELYPQYKAQRRSRPDLLKAQWPALAPLVQAFGYPNVTVQGYEADDVIASLAEQARQQKIPVTIVTGDRDIFQLIDDHGYIEVMATARGITETKTYDKQAVIDRYNLPPALIPDFYGLKGDTSDNIPGVPGIGEKTASQLIQRFGSLEAVLSSVEQISGAKRKQNLIDYADAARVSKRLATIDKQVQTELRVSDVIAAPPDRSHVRQVFRKHELRDPLKRLEEALGAEAEAVAQHPSAATQVVCAKLRTGGPNQIEQVKGQELALLARAPEAPEGELFATDSRWSFAVAGESEVLCGECDGPQQLLAACGTRAIVTHDAKALAHVPKALSHDTMIAAYLLEPARRGYPFQELCEERGIVVSLDPPSAANASKASAASASAPNASEPSTANASKSSAANAANGSGPNASKSTSKPSAADASQSLAQHVLKLKELARLQREQIAQRNLQRLLTQIELPLISVLNEMEQVGVRLNLQRLAEITGRVREETASLEAEIFALAGEEFLIASPQQLGEILFVKLGLSKKRRGKTGFSTDARVLQAIRDEHQIVPKIERWRELSTLIKTYLDVLPQMVDERSRIHTTFLQTVAQTGRLSSTNPNMQNVPVRTPLGREIRGCFEAEPHNVLIAADYSQIELRVLANVAEEPALMEIFERGEDVHTATASRVFGVAPQQIDHGMRSKAKMINYGIVYGLSDFGLADRLNIPIDEAKAVIDAYLARFPKIAAFIAQTIADATDAGWVGTLWGRRRQVPELKARNYQVRSQGERLAVNTVIQGTAADIIKLAMLRCDEALKQSDLHAKLILTIHDELLFEMKDDPAEVQAAKVLIQQEMCGVWEREPALAVDIGVGSNWLEAK